ncbi:MAG: RagB/SusD family nutrient uptake outer membrane protein [Bacteroidales bacterium]|nr:RagB/SusD family nutrient uptake outer membrane protein [Bacteroidales bacterium]
MWLLLPLLGIWGVSCNYLDVVPEGTPVLDNAFSMRAHTLRYLYTCYSYLPSHIGGNTPDIQGCDEAWILDNPQYEQGIGREGCRIVRGQLTPSSPVYDTWGYYYIAIRECNNFLEGIERITVPDLPEPERQEWIGEVKALKAWYHFLLFRQYGPVPVVKENLPVGTDVDGVQVARNTVDEVIDYVVQLLDESMETLPSIVRSEQTDLGRFTLPIAAALKAKVLVTAASPLFNCNTEFAPMRNPDGTQLFPQDESERAGKWTRAADACREAVDICMNSMGMKLYVFPGDPRYNLSGTTVQQMSLRQAFCEDWNSETIWADTRDWVVMLQAATTPTLNPMYMPTPGMAQVFSVPLQIAEMFYSENGVPIEEDRDWGYDARYTLRRAEEKDRYYIRKGAETSRVNFEREPRFYAWLGCDQGIWYGSGSYDDTYPENLYYLSLRRFTSDNTKEPTGYLPKKWVHYQSAQPASYQFAPYPYLWPNFRLADLLLYCAEALNEAEDSQAARQEAMRYADMVRGRAGLQPIETAWRDHSNNPGKYTSQNGLRDILQRERMIEMCFEGSRFWDLRRWKTAREVLNRPIESWSGFNSTPEEIFKPYNMYAISFGLKDYFWPINESELTKSRNLKQSLGWE